jgi:transposase-like protein
MADVTKNPVFTDAAAARAHLERIRWPEGVLCVHCGAYGDAISVVQKTQKRRRPKTEGKRHKPARLGRYYCKACEGTFTVTVGTVMEDSHIPLNKWLHAFYLMLSSEKGVSSHQLHRTLGVSYKSAWFMSQRIREALRSGFPEQDRFGLNHISHTTGVEAEARGRRGQTPNIDDDVQLRRGG